MLAAGSSCLSTSRDEHQAASLAFVSGQRVPSSHDLLDAQPSPWRRQSRCPGQGHTNHCPCGRGCRHEVNPCRARIKTGPEPYGPLSPGRSGRPGSLLGERVIALVVNCPPGDVTQVINCVIGQASAQPGDNLDADAEELGPGINRGHRHLDPVERRADLAYQDSSDRTVRPAPAGDQGSPRHRHAGRGPANQDAFGCRSRRPVPRSLPLAQRAGRGSHCG
jgi:hypothetical protein